MRGITEQALYGVNLKFIFSLIGAMVGGGEGMLNFFNTCSGAVIAIVVSFVVTFILYSVWAKNGKLDPSETGNG